MFSCIEFADSKENITIPGVIMKLPKRAQKWYIQRYLPIKTDRIKILEREGEVIYLPFVRETINWFEKEEITSMLNRIIVTREAQNIITAKEMCIRDRFRVVCGKLCIKRVL